MAAPRRHRQFKLRITALYISPIVRLKYFHDQPGTHVAGKCALP